MSLEWLLRGIKTTLCNSIAPYVLAFAACAGSATSAVNNNNTDAGVRKDAGSDMNVCVDNDNDGYFANCGKERDCDDYNSQVHPSALEFCDLIDNNCNGKIDEEAQFPFYLDNDADGFGDPNEMVKGCIDTFGNPKGKDLNYVTNNNDCDDKNSAINPNAFEFCDGVDNNCREGVDEMYDLDAACDAGIGECYQEGVYRCALDGLSAVCDAIAGMPSAELCDGLDNDCDGEVDEEGGDIFYADADGDGRGDPFVATINCAPPVGYVANPSDCDDIDATRWQNLPAYRDDDGDGFGAGILEVVCTGAELPEGYAANDADCDDSVYETHPGALEVCDGFDNDCDGIVDDDFNIGDLCDNDLRGECYRTGEIVCSEDLISSYCSVPLAVPLDEECNGLDDNCDGEADNGLTAPSRECSAGIGECFDLGLDYQTCLGAEGWSAEYSGCTAVAGESAPELCDGLDNDCDDEIDELLDCNACTPIENTVGYWSFDEESGATAYDIGGNDLDGTLSDVASRGAGVYNGGLSLDGIDDLIRVPRDALMDLQELTITHWIRKSSERQARIVCRHEDGGADGGYATEISAERKFAAIIRGYAYASNSAIPLNEWTHLAITLDEEGTLKLYINGELDAERTLNIPIRPTSSLDLVMGRQANSPGANHFQGNLDEVKIYSCVLNDTQIRDDYEND